MSFKRIVSLESGRVSSKQNARRGIGDNGCRHLCQALYYKGQQRNGVVAKGNVATEKLFLKIRDIKACLCNVVSQWIQ